MIILDPDAETSIQHGVEPSNRSIQQLLDSGFIILDSPGYLSLIDCLEIPYLEYGQ